MACLLQRGVPCSVATTARRGSARPHALALWTMVCTARIRVVELAHRPTGAGNASEVT